MFKRVDMMARSLIALIESGSCFAGTMAEIVFAAEPLRSCLLARPGRAITSGAATLHLSALNFSAYPMGNGLSRLANRFYGEPQTRLTTAAGLIGDTAGR